MKTTRKSTSRTTAILCVVIVAATSLPSDTLAEAPQWVARGTQCMVASDHPEASRAGLEILRAGGNAIDAACAVSFALAVTRPQSTGLGGGGFLIARLAYSGEVVVLDFRETAPHGATPDMYDRAAAADPGGPAPSRHGCLAAAVPGLLAGRVAALERLGTLELAEVLAPAIRLADEGFGVDQHYVNACTTVARHYTRHAKLRHSCRYVWQVHLRSGSLREPGDTLRQPALARLLRAVATHGSDVFYKGAVAQAIEREMRAGGGIITASDLSQYMPVYREPLISSYRGYQIIAMPPSSSGGTCLIEALNILETVDLGGIGKRDKPLAAHYLVEAMKHAFADRARWMADADFVDVPTELLISKAHAARLAHRVDPAKTFASDRYGTLTIPGDIPAPGDDGGTSHFCIIDRWGNSVVSTETINTSFGSLAAVPEWGLILNNEMDDFTAHSGRGNAFDLFQSRRNVVAPGKRPLSSMSPTIVLAEGKPLLLLGGSGGPRIISSVLNVLVGVLDFRQSLPDAVADHRVHHQWKPDRIVFDAPWADGPFFELTERGHTIAKRHQTGIIQAIIRTSDGLVGASDPRKGGRPAGY